MRGANTAMHTAYGESSLMSANTLSQKNNVQSFMMENGLHYKSTLPNDFLTKSQEEPIDDQNILVQTQNRGGTIDSTDNAPFIPDQQHMVSILTAGGHNRGDSTDIEKPYKSKIQFQPEVEED